MSEVQARQLQLILQASIGQMNDLRRQRILEALGAGWAAQPIPNQPTVAFINPTTRSSLVFAEQQMNYAQESQNLQLGSSEIADLLSPVREALLLEDRFPMALQLVGYMDANGAATERSVEYFSPYQPERLRESFPGLRGIGIRINYDEGPFSCDLRFEPFFAEPSHYFIQLNVSTPTALSLNQLSEDAARFVDRFRTESERFLEDVAGES